MISTVSDNMAAAQSILHNILMICFMMTIGLTYASSALIGKNIGANDIPKAKSYLRLLTTFGLSIAFI